MSSPPPSWRPRGRQAVLLVVLAGVVVLVRLMWPVDADLPVRLAATLRGTGTWGVVAFVAIYMVSAVAFVPGSVLTLLAGFVYGPWWGLLLASPASVAAASTAFLLGRTLLRARAARIVARSPRAAAIEAAVRREGFRLVLLLRLSPVFPFTLLNYALSLSPVPLRTYVVASFFGMLPATALYAYLGSLVPAAAGLRTVRADGLAGGMLYVGGFVATVLVVVVVTRAARRALAAELDDRGS